MKVSRFILFLFYTALIFVVLSIGILTFENNARASMGQELHIYKDGSVHMVEAEVIKKHAANFLRVDIWGQKWGIIIDYATEFESAYGAEIKMEEIEVGHRLEVKGRPIPGEAGTIEALYIRDLSIKVGISPTEPQVVSTVSSSTDLRQRTPLPAAEPPPAVTSRLLTKHLRMGMRGGEVIILQEFLQKYGWGIPNNGPVTGYFGKVTQNALIAFQKAKGLEPAGETDLQTRTAINAILSGKSNDGVVSSSSVSTLESTSLQASASTSASTSKKILTQYLYRGLRGGEVMILQEFLQKYGWGIPNDGPVTGYFGVVTENAVKKFQRANGLEAVGTVGPKTRELINSILLKQ